MIKKAIKRNIVQIVAITEKNLKFNLRFKSNIIMNYLIPMISIVIPLIVMGQIFQFRDTVGPWSEKNFIIYQLIAYNLTLSRVMITSFPIIFDQEKYWETLPALMIAPFRRINLVFGIFFSNLIIITIPFAFIIFLSYFIYPITFLTLLFVFGLYFLIALIFSGIGIIIGVFAISKEGVIGILKFLIALIFWFSCLSFPFYIFPEILRNVIALNPLFHIFEALRLTWIENNVLLSITSHPFSFLTIILGAIFLPLIGVIIFNKIYKKYGIVGY